jgi:hypothetical protein
MDSNFQFLKSSIFYTAPELGAAQFKPDNRRSAATTRPARHLCPKQSKRGPRRETAVEAAEFRIRRLATSTGGVGGVPALHDALEALRPVVLAVPLEPLGLDQAAT